MKSCRNCGELLGDSVDVCFKCRYSYAYGRVLTEEERTLLNSQSIEGITRREEELKKREEMKREQLIKNPLFEYKVVVINDLPNGQIDDKRIQLLLDTMSQDGWRLHSIFNSEVGKNATGVSIGGFGSQVNATIDQTVLIFERCIKA